MTDLKLPASLLLKFLNLQCIEIQFSFVLLLCIVLRGIFLAEVSEELEVDEFEQGSIEFEEGAHYFIVNIEGQSLIKLVRCNPSYLLTHDLYLVVYALD